MKLIANMKPDWLHFSDIDIGGFKIFKRLRENIAPNAIPYMMDNKTLLLNLDKAQKADNSYLEELKKLLVDDSFCMFHEAIKTMLEHKVRLEQESLI